MKAIVWTTPDDAAQGDSRYWARQSVHTRVAAVEELRPKLKARP